MSAEKAWDELKAVALHYAATVSNPESSSQQRLFAEISLRGAARNYADESEFEEDE